MFFFSGRGGDLQTLLEEDLVPYERDVITFVQQLLQALEYCHDLNLVHLDIKVKICTVKSGVLVFILSLLFYFIDNWGFFKVPSSYLA